MTYCRSIEDFKAVLEGGGVRPTMFQVEMNFPPDVVQDPAVAINDGTFLIKSAALPASTVGQIAVPFRGRKLKVSGDREFADWTVTVINDVTFTVRKAFEEWSEKIQNHNYTCGANRIKDYFANAIVRQFDRDGNQLRSYLMNGVWPSEIGEISLDFETTNTVETYDVTFAVQYWGSAETGEPIPNATYRKSTADLNSVST